MPALARDEAPATRGRVVLITHESPHARMVANALARQVNVSGIVVVKHGPFPPSPSSSTKQLVLRLVGPRRYRWLARTKAYWQMGAVRRRMRRIERRLRRAARTALAQHANGADGAWPPDIPMHLTSDVNGHECVAWCRLGQPAAIAVFGAPVLRKHLIALPILGTINAHCSLLPAYRAAWPEFWQVLRRDYEHCGVTVHYIDEGVDTGDIILQQAVRAGPDTDPWMLRVYNARVIASLLPEATKAVLEGDAPRTPQPPSSAPPFRSRDVTIDKYVGLFESLGFEIGGKR